MPQGVDRPRDRPARVVFLGGFGGSNIGNEASLAVAWEVLREVAPDAEVMIATPNPERARDKYGVGAVSLIRAMANSRHVKPRGKRLLVAAIEQWRSLVEVRALLRWADLALVPGTGLLDDFEEKAWGMPLAIATWSWAACLLRRPLVLFAIGAGPIRSPVNRFLMLSAARAARELTFRDRRSREYVEAHGLAKPAGAVTCDIAFGATLPPARAARTGSGIRMGVGVMAYGGWGAVSSDQTHARYLDTLAAVVRRLVADGDEIDLLIGQDVDERAVDSLLDRLDHGVLTHVRRPEIADYQQLLEVVAGVDVVVATRFHNVVAALSLGRPVVSLGYAPKNHDLLSAFGLEGFDQAVEQADVTWVLDRITQIRQGLATVDPRVQSARADWRSSTRNALKRTYFRHGIGAPVEFRC